MHSNKPALLLTLLIAHSQAFASGGTGEYQLNWSVRTEILAYRSCGCGDACWIAEVRSKTAGKVKARLRCDCEKLYFSVPGKKTERIVASSCEAINDSDAKAALIAEKLLDLIRLTNTGAAKPEASATTP